MKKSSALTDEHITHRAREIWQTRGSPAGQDLAIWLEAEKQLRADRDKPESIDADKLQERLNEINPVSAQRSPTSVNLT